MKRTITSWLFGAGAVGVLAVAILAGDMEPPTRPALIKNVNGWYHTHHCAAVSEPPATPPLIRCAHLTTRDLATARERQQSDSYVGSKWADIKDHPASQTPRIWGNRAPGRP